MMNHGRAKESGVRVWGMTRERTTESRGEGAVGQAGTQTIQALVEGASNPKIGLDVFITTSDIG